jgi:hypothetical protein
MAKFNKCPTCGMPIANGEKLIAYYHPDRDWWVVAHTAPGDEDQHFASATITIPRAKIICQQARYETPVLIGQRGSS